MDNGDTPTTPRLSIPQPSPEAEEATQKPTDASASDIAAPTSTPATKSEPTEAPLEAATTPEAAPEGEPDPEETTLRAIPEEAQTKAETATSTAEPVSAQTELQSDDPVESTEATEAAPDEAAEAQAAETAEVEVEPVSVQESEPEPITAEVEPAPTVAQESAPEPAAEEVDTAATIQVPLPQTSTPAPTLPYVSVDDLLALSIASDPQLSPDGTLIAFTLQQSYATQNTSAIWLANSSGGKNALPWQVSSGGVHDTLPRWSPNGRMLAFLSDRSGTRQIYVLPLNGGEARQISILPQGVSEYSWHPNGTSLIAHSPWKSVDDQPVQAPNLAATTVYTRLDTRHDGQGQTQGRHQQLWLVPLAGRATRLTSETVDLVQSCWSPDGTELAFCANRRTDPDLHNTQALWVLTLATGQLRRLTPEDGLAYYPAWSPDGRELAYLSAPDATEAGNYSPWLVSAAGNDAPRPAVPGAENLNCQCWIVDELRSEWLAPPCWYPDSKALLVPVQERGQVHLYRLNLVQQTIGQLTSNNGRFLSPQLSKDGKLLVTIRADWFTPGDLWLMDSLGKQPRKLTGVNDSFLQSHQLTRPRRVSWQSFDNETIEGWLYLPQLAPGARAPLILAPHGGPFLAWGDSYVHEFQVLAGRGYAVLAPNLRGSAGYGEEFSRKVINDWGGSDFRDLLTGLAHVIATEPIDGARLGIGGMSYGGYLACWASSQTTRFKAAVCRNGFTSLTSSVLLSEQAAWFAQVMPDAAKRSERSPLTFADQIQTPLLLLHAEDDLACPFSEAYQLFTVLRRRKHLTVLIGYRAASHLLDWPGVGAPQQRLDRLRRTVEWFERLV